jgi:DNA-binding NarL/FixJ family response regulator
VGRGIAPGGTEPVTTTVLVVDDSAPLRRLVRMALDMTDWTVVGEAANGEEGVLAAYELAPDVVILDQQMPVLSGLSALPRLRRASPSSRIIMWSNDPIAHQGLSLGASAVVDKNQPLDHLLMALALVAPSRVYTA